jgi:CHAD domain-containing protein
MEWLSGHLCRLCQHARCGARLRYHLPVLVYQRLAAVRALGDSLEHATYAHLHRLRLRFKELRYTLQFFAPLLGEEATALIPLTEQFQQQLGLLNDAHVALTWLAETPGCDQEVAAYTLHRQEEYTRCLTSLYPLWQSFNTAETRQQLARGLAV